MACKNKNANPFPARKGKGKYCFRVKRFLSGSIAMTGRVVITIIKKTKIHVVALTDKIFRNRFWGFFKNPSSSPKPERNNADIPTTIPIKNTLRLESMQTILK